MKKTILITTLVGLLISANASDYNTIGGKVGLDFYNNKDGKGTPSFETGKVLVADTKTKMIIATEGKVNANGNYKIAGVVSNANITADVNVLNTSIKLIPFIAFENSRSESTLNDEVKHYTDNYIVFGTVATLPNNFSARADIKGGFNTYRVETSIDYKLNKDFGVSATVGNTSFYNNLQNFKNQSDVNIGLSFQF